MPLIAIAWLIGLACDGPHSNPLDDPSWHAPARAIIQAATSRFPKGTATTEAQRSLAASGFSCVTRPAVTDNAIFDSFARGLRAGTAAGDAQVLRGPFLLCTRWEGGANGIPSRHVGLYLLIGDGGRVGDIAVDVLNF